MRDFSMEDDDDAPMSNGARGWSDAVSGTELGPIPGSDEEGQAEYDEGRNEGDLYLSDSMVDQIEADYLDGACTISGDYH